ncbi:MAG: hypothetical protein V8S69_03850 [Dakarella massiliensis]
MVFSFSSRVENEAIVVFTQPIGNEVASQSLEPSPTESSVDAPPISMTRIGSVVGIEALDAAEVGETRLLCSGNDVNRTSENRLCPSEEV